MLRAAQLTLCAALQESARAAERGAECEARLRESGEQREEMRRGLRAAEEERRKPDPRVEELQRELAETKGHHQQQLQHEIRKVRGGVVVVVRVVAGGVGIGAGV